MIVHTLNHKSKSEIKKNPYKRHYSTKLQEIVSAWQFKSCAVTEMVHNVRANLHVYTYICIIGSLASIHMLIMHLYASTNQHIYILYSCTRDEPCSERCTFAASLLPFLLDDTTLHCCTAYFCSLSHFRSTPCVYVVCIDTYIEGSEHSTHLCTFLSSLLRFYINVIFPPTQGSHRLFFTNEL